MTSPPLIRRTLDNGLRYVLLPMPSVSAAAVVVCYGTGFRHELPGRTGFAHLYEHLMAQGSVNLPKLEHKRLLQREGGFYGAMTRADYTYYSSRVPSQALELALFCEADRMLGLRTTEDDLRNEIAVVKEEIKLQILDRPYGGFPWFDIDALAFDTFANSHDGYGDFADLDRSTLEDVLAFYDDEYGTRNAVLAVAGGFRPDEAARMIERHFAPIPSRPAPVRSHYEEPPLTGPRHARRVDPRVSSTATAVAWRAPTPAKAFDDYVAVRLLLRILAEGDTSRVSRRLKDRDGLASHVSGSMGNLSDFQGTSGPTCFWIEVYHRGNGVAEAIADEVRRLCDDLRDDELELARAALLGRYQRAEDAVLAAASTGCVLELGHGNAGLRERVPVVWSRLRADDLRDLAHRLCVDTHPVVVEVVPP